MSSVSTSRSKKIDPLSKKVPVNPKYKDIKPTIDTGFSQTKYLAKLEELKRDYKFRKDEIFKRMKVSTFVQLIIQVSDFEKFLNSSVGNGDGSESVCAEDTEIEKITQTDADSLSSVTPLPSETPTPDTSRSRLEQVIKGVGEVDVDAPPPKPKKISEDTSPYLLLDVRDLDSFEACRLISAKNYPTAMLARSVNYETKEMLAFKNQEGKIIVIYDEDEKIAPRAATTLVQRGYDNLFMLSGGLKVAYKYFPEGLITGTPPTSVTEKKAPKETIPATQNIFTQNDLDSLSVYLESPPTDSGRSSKASTSSRMSTSSVMTGRSINSVRSESSIHPKPFKV